MSGRYPMLFLAIRYLVARKRQTLLTLMAILFGSAAFVTISGFFGGFQNFLLDQLVNNDAHLHVYAREDLLTEHGLDRSFFPASAAVMWASAPSGRKDSARILDPEGWYRRMDSDPRVAAYSPLLTAQIILSRAKSTVSAKLVGCEARKQERVSNIRQYMNQGSFSDIATGGNRIILGDDLLRRLGTRVDETVLVSTGQAVPIPFKVVGTFHVGVRTMDDGAGYASLADVQRLNQTPAQVNDIAVRLHDYEQATELANAWAKTSEDKVQSWAQINANFLNVFRIQNATKTLVIAVILLVASFGIYNILNVTVNQKRKDIAILRSMGYEAQDVKRLFLLQGVVLGVSGGLIGLALGFAASKYLTTIDFAGGAAGAGGKLKVLFAGAIYVRSLVISAASATLAAYLPARAAGKMEPIEIIRQGAE